VVHRRAGGAPSEKDKLGGIKLIYSHLVRLYILEYTKRYVIRNPNP
jgi:hypothetical protein